MSKTRLDIDYEMEFLLFGISSHVKDYRLCGAVNNKLGIDLERQEDVVIPLPESEEFNGFSHYVYLDEENGLKYIVLSNRGDISYLIQEQKQADYFLLIEGTTEELDKNKLMNKLKEIDHVLTIYELDPNKLQSRQNLILE